MSSEWDAEVGHEAGGRTRSRPSAIRAFCLVAVGGCVRSVVGGCMCTTDGCSDLRGELPHVHSEVLAAGRYEGFEGPRRRTRSVNEMSTREDLQGLTQLHRESTRGRQAQRALRARVSEGALQH